MLIVLRSSWALLARHDAADGRQRHAGHAAGYPRRDRGVLDLRRCRSSCRPISWASCFGSRMAPDLIRRVGHVRVFAALGSMISAVLILYAAAPELDGMDADARGDRVFLLGRLHHRRKLAERRLDQRKPGPGAVALHDRADGRHHRGAGAAELRRSVGLHPVRHPLGPGVDRLRADPAVGRAGAGVRDDQAA